MTKVRAEGRRGARPHRRRGRAGRRRRRGPARRPTWAGATSTCATRCCRRSTSRTTRSWWRTTPTSRSWPSTGTAPYAGAGEPGLPQRPGRGRRRHHRRRPAAARRAAATPARSATSGSTRPARVVRLRPARLPGGGGRHRRAGRPALPASTGRDAADRPRARGRRDRPPGPQASEPAVLTALREAGQHLGHGISLLSNVVNPEVRAARRLLRAARAVADAGGRGRQLRAPARSAPTPAAAGSPPRPSGQVAPPSAGGQHPRRGRRRHPAGAAEGPPAGAGIHQYLLTGYGGVVRPCQPLPGHATVSDRDSDRLSKRFDDTRLSKRFDDAHAMAEARSG